MRYYSVMILGVVQTRFVFFRVQIKSLKKHHIAQPCDRTISERVVIPELECVVQCSISKSLCPVGTSCVVLCVGYFVKCSREKASLLQIELSAEAFGSALLGQVVVVSTFFLTHVSICTATADSAAFQTILRLQRQMLPPPTTPDERCQWRHRLRDRTIQFARKGSKACSVCSGWSRLSN